ncbi:hypothetical protein [Evansella cellulosilytica]|uniref:Uncharacterized protein n=1 Tax=Evansella cellulosilytica (strain ATCC 21833 / DSM 2522 / FERM P-1141 / JCM 9156 / N-4) TaxID=649639 RepID=E6TTC6_EVAC2|nr:hypothetical protein [Evansella cellulosilytica]ADU28466.1 hypothetical protein Bcell_0177 [Evansella cellulosilytica DSM 2522]
MSLKKGYSYNNKIEGGVKTLDELINYVQYRKEINEFNGICLLDREGNPIILSIVKGVGEDLNSHVKQTGRYFSYVNSIRIAILTNMDEMYFYSDFNKTGVMDEIPFYKIHLDSFTEQDADFLLQFRRTYFLDHCNELYAKWKEQYSN